jgi:glycosyltransferase involved in cell wall biosynthesis
MSKRRLHVAWDNALAGRNRTGTGVYASELIRELSADPELHLEVFNGWNIGRRSDGLVARGTRSLSNLCWNDWYFPRLIRSRDFDILHSPAFVAPVPCPCPTVVTIHDLSFRIFPEQFGSRWPRYVTSIMPSVLQAVSAVICVSHHSKQELLKFYKIANDKIHVVYNGIDHRRFNPAATMEAGWARTMGLHENYILHVGDLSGRKNIPRLLGAIAHLRSAGKLGNRQLALVGPESRGMVGAAEIHKTIRDLDLAGTVVLLGRVADEHMAGLYLHASLLVMPSLHEGFGIPVVESMAVGTPVVTSNSSSLPEVAGGAAILVPPTDEQALACAIADVISNAKIAAELRAKGLIQAKKFSWQRSAAETRQVYRHVAE